VAKTTPWLLAVPVVELAKGSAPDAQQSEAVAHEIESRFNGSEATAEVADQITPPSSVTTMKPFAESGLSFSMAMQ
jgi:hypothetical protein